MSTFKTDLYEICKDVAREFAGWTFTSGQFKSKSLKHTDLIIHPGFGFEHGTTPLQPSVTIDNKRAMKLSKLLLGIERSTSIVSFQVVSQLLKHTPVNLRLGGWVVEDRAAFLAASPNPKAIEDQIVDFAEVRDVLVATMKDGISFIETHYDLSSEENLLKGLPAKYATRHANSPYDQMEMQKGVMVCIVHVLLGDFDFIERYSSDAFETVFPKRVEELNRILAALPELKRRYAETGSVV
ncbi:hypothetical protein [Paraburkholderia fungorum]|jgi:hypothetical protein|uniref:hypothetical protein n=1 Tax=Paraburkholderia fungorum TaxID=134537 RepID=UPI000DB52162|nr:hypothetical protein [Paraburkholderia fungorum]PZR47985.1 MAG: hypothetical protein DI523_12355 [Paraburkholderia fungorum]